MQQTRRSSSNILYLIYDGDCILCRNTAQVLKIKKSVGQLEIINARSNHPLISEVITKGYDLNEGILVKYQDQFFYGANALSFLALISSKSDFLNRLNGYLFKSKYLSACAYPLFKLVRNTLLHLRKIPPIPQTTQKNLITLIFDDNNAKLPTILKMRYSNRPYSTDKLLLQGRMNITFSRIYRILLPLFRLAGGLVPYAAEDIPVNVEFSSNERSAIICMHRTFHYPNKKPYHFQSFILHVKDNVVIELMRFKLAARLIYIFKDQRIIMKYGGYVFRLGKYLIPLPLGFILGKFDAVEIAESDEVFSMQVNIVHPIFGKIFQYDGKFSVAK